MIMHFFPDYYILLVLANDNLVDYKDHNLILNDTLLDKNLLILHLESIPYHFHEYFLLNIPSFVFQSPHMQLLRYNYEFLSDLFLNQIIEIHSHTDNKLIYNLSIESFVWPYHLHSPLRKGMCDADLKVKEFLLPFQE